MLGSARWSVVREMSEPDLRALPRAAGAATARLEPEALLELMARLGPSSRFVQKAGTSSASGFDCVEVMR